VLRLMADRGEGEHARPGADARAAGYDSVAYELDVLLEHHLGADDAIGADDHARPELGARLDDGSRMGGHLTHACWSRRRQMRGPPPYRRAWRTPRPRRRWRR